MSAGDYNLAILEDLFRGKAREGARSPEGLDAAMSEALLTLGEHERNVLLLRYREGLSLRNCGTRVSNRRTKTVGVTGQAVRSVQRKALRKLARRPTVLMLRPFAKTVGIVE